MQGNIIKKRFMSFAFEKTLRNRGILVYNICLISISNSDFDGVTNKSVLNIEMS